MSTKLLIAITSILLVVILCLGATAFYFHKAAVEKDGQLSQLQSELDESKAIQALQAFQFQRSNEIAAQAGRYNVTIAAKSEERQIENRKDLKTEECADRYIPDATAQRMYDYTDGLRARAMRHSGQPDGTLTGTTSPSRMTYRQAVLWIDPLLTLLDRANNDRESIRSLPSQQPVKQE
ncbi:phage exported protein [Yersinia frederiksenii]|nr:phage exported protein [Yersinia frederiksenii]